MSRCRHPSDTSPRYSDRLTADRNQRVKDARGEAAKEIEAYKAQKEEEFKAYEQEVSSLQPPDPSRPFKSDKRDDSTLEIQTRFRKI